MPFLDRLDLAAVSGMNDQAVHSSLSRLQAQGLAACLRHGSPLTDSTRRWHVTAEGLRRLAVDAETSMERLLRTRPVSAHWQRLLLARLDAVAVIYRLASSAGRPYQFRWYRSAAAGRRHDAAWRKDLGRHPAGSDHRPYRLLRPGAVARESSRVFAPRPAGPDARRGAPAPGPEAAVPLPRPGVPGDGARGSLRRFRRRGVADHIHRRRPVPERGPGPYPLRWTSAGGAAADQEDAAYRSDRAGRARGSSRATAFHRPQTRREAGCSTISPTGPGSRLPTLAD